MGICIDAQTIAFCLISALAACMDGFQTKIPGSLIANRGFINQFGELWPSGQTLNTQEHCTMPKAT